MPSTFVVAAKPRTASGGLRLAGALPASVDLTASTLPAGNQGQVNSCMAWTIGYSILGWYSKSTKHYGAPFAPMYLYSQSHAGTGDNGSSSNGNYSVLESQGIAEKSVYTQGDFAWSTLPTAAQKANAALHKGIGHTYLFANIAAHQGQTGIDAIKAALAAGSPVVMGIPVYSPFYALNSTDSVMTAAKATGSLIGYHAVAAFGYDSTGLIIENSWASTWGRSGFATLSWDFVGTYAIEASTLTGLIAPAAPAVTAMSGSAASLTGGTALTVTGTGFTTVDAGSAGAISLTNAAAGLTQPLTVTSRTSTSLTVAVPAPPNGAPTSGWRVVVTNPAGSSADVTADDVTYVSPSGAVFDDTYVPAYGKPIATVTGVNFGASATEFAASGVTATINGVTARLAWISPTKLSVAVPAGKPGTQASLVLSKGGVTGPPSTVTYASAVSGILWTTEAATGAQVGTVSGAGLLGSTAWTLTGPGGATLGLDPVAGRTALTTSESGVVITSDISAVIKIPADPKGAAGTWAVSFTPNATAYPGATTLTTATSKATYQPLAVTKLSLAAASTQGGTRTTVTGVGLGSLGLTDATAVAVIGSDGTSRAGSVISRTSTTAVLELPAGPAGAARIVVSSPLGTSADVLGDNLVYVDPLSAAFVASTVPGTGATKMPLVGIGFGSNATEFAALKLTAQVNGLTSPLTWVSATQLLTTVPIGTPGKAATFVLYRSGVAGTPSVATYTAAIGSVGWTTDAATGALTGKLSGAGFTSSSAWTLTGPTGAQLPLPVVASTTALAAAPQGVLLVSGTSATVKLPANPGASGAWTLSFTPDQATYPGAAFGATATAAVTFAAPSITKLSGPAASVHGGTAVTVTGSSLASLNPADTGAATLTNAAGDTLTASLVSRTATSAVVTLPAAAAGTWTLRLTSSLGTSAAVSAANVSFVEPLSAAFDALFVPASGAARVTLSGSGFGANATEFAALVVTAKVGTVVLRPTWVSSTQLTVALPAGKPGTSATLVLYRNGVPGSTTSIAYAAAIATASYASGTTSVTGTLSGAGLLGSTSWTLTGPSGQTVAVPVVTTGTALTAATTAVLVTSDRAATVKVPAHPGAAGTWTLSFTPSAALYPSATYLVTDLARLTYL